MKGKITFALVSLVFTAFDYSLGKEVLLSIYGSSIAGIVSSPAFSALYFLLVFTLEALTLYAVSGALRRAVRKRFK